MQRRKKQLLGLVGLALVAAITAIAFAIPSPEASAVEAGSVNLMVKVEDKPIEGTPTATLIVPPTPADGSERVDQSLTIKFSHRYANNSTVVTLTKYAADGTTVLETTEIPVGGDGCIMDGSEGGECTLTYDLGPLPTVENPAENANYGVKYKLTVTPKYGNQVGLEDSVTFFQRAMYIKYENRVDSENNPYVSAYIGDKAGIEYALVQVYDKVTKEPIIMKDGAEAPIRITADQIKNAANGKIEVLLPLSQYNLKAGTYFVTLVAFGTEKDNEGNNKIVAISSTDVPYSPKNGGGTDPGKPDEPGPDNPDEPGGVTPEVPGTGSILRDLNISRADYLIVGLIAFGMVTGFAIYLIVRRNKR